MRALRATSGSAGSNVGTRKLQAAIVQSVRVSLFGHSRPEPWAVQWWTADRKSICGSGKLNP